LLKRPFSKQKLAASYYASQQYKYTHFKQKYKVQKFSKNASPKLPFLFHSCSLHYIRIIVTFPFCQQQPVWYMVINQLYTNASIVLYPGGIWCKQVQIFSLTHSFVWRLVFVYVSKWNK